MTLDTLDLKGTESQEIKKDEKINNQKPVKKDKQATSERKWILYKYRWLMLFCYCSLSVSTHSGYFIFTSSSHLTRTFYMISIVAVNTLDIVYDLFIPLAIPFSYFADTCGLRAILTAASCLNALGAMTRFASTKQKSYGLLVVGSSIGAFSLAGILFLPPRVAGNWFGEEERALATGIMVASDSVGMILGIVESAIFLKSSDSMLTVGDDFKNIVTTQAVHAIATFVFVVFAARDKPLSPPSLRQAKEYKKPFLTDSTDLKSSFGLSNGIVSNTNPIKPLNTKEESNVLNHFHLFNGAQNDIKITFWKDILYLLTNQNFFVIVTMNCMAHIVESIFTIFLNENLIIKFPDKGEMINVMAITGIALGIIGNVIAGCILQKFGCYFLLTFVLLGTMLVAVFSFWVLYIHTLQFYAMFCAATLALTTGMSYFTVAFEHAAYLTSPISENRSGMLLVLSSGAVNTIYGFGGSKVLEFYGPSSFFSISISLACLLPMLLLSWKIKDWVTDACRRAETVKN